MLSGAFEHLFVSEIQVNRDLRQRRELVDIDELAASIKETGGLIHPIVVTRDKVLVAGERRLTAYKTLKWDQIPVQYADTLDTVELALLELEENVKRVDLSWQDQNDAIMAYHTLKNSQNPDWNLSRTAESLGLSTQTVSKHAMIYEERQKKPELSKAEKLSVAHSITQRSIRRREASALDVLLKPKADINKLDEAIEAVTRERKAELLNASFLDWSQTEQTKHNFIHCDFPYGIGTGDKTGQSAAKAFGKYDDGEDVYWELLKTFLTNQNNFIAPSAHCMFWFSLKFYAETVKAFRDAGWAVNITPLIWGKSDNSGIIPDQMRMPRQNYETALLCARGDRPIITPISNIYWGPGTKENHQAEKPRPMLSHFFRMFVDENTLMLDPTCGSGNAVLVSEELGAPHSVGIEKELDFYETAKYNLKL